MNILGESTFVYSTLKQATFFPMSWARQVKPDRSREKSREDRGGGTPFPPEKQTLTLCRFWIKVYIFQIMKDCWSIWFLLISNDFNWLILIFVDFLKTSSELLMKNHSKSLENQWQSLKIHWNSLKFLGIRVKSKEFKGIPRKSKKFKEIQNNSKDFKRHIRNSMESQRMQRKLKEFKRIGSNSMEFKGRLWNSKDFRGIQRNSWGYLRNSKGFLSFSSGFSRVGLGAARKGTKIIYNSLKIYGVLYFC